MTTTSIRTCPICEAGCGLELELDGDRVVKIRGDELDVMSAGFLCPKGALLGDLEADPDRLTGPRVRRDGVSIEVSWDEAYAAAAEGLQRVIEEHGPGSVAVYLGNPISHSLSGLLYIKPFAKAFRTKHIYSASSIDSHPRYVSCGLMFGHQHANPVPDIDRTDLLVVFGGNPMASNGSLWTVPNFPGRLRALHERGGRLVVVDPRRTQTARKADVHLSVRPGTDALVLAAIVSTMAEEGLISDAVDANGREEVIAALVPFTPERVSAATGLEASAIRDLAREIATTERAAVYGRMGISTVRFGTVTNWLVDVVNILVGNLDREGGVMFPLPATYSPRNHPFSMGRWRSRVRGLPEVTGEMPLSTLADEIETPGEGQVKAMVVFGGNPLISNPQAGRLERAIDSLEFMVCIDPQMNATTRMADVVLPPPRTITRGHYDVFFSGNAVRNYANYSAPSVDRPADIPDEWEILLTLGAIAKGATPPVDAAALDDEYFRETLARAAADPGLDLPTRDVDELATHFEGRSGPERLLDLALRVGPYGDRFGGDPEGLSLAVLEAEPHGRDLGPLQPRLPGVVTTPSGRIEMAHAEILAELEGLAALADAADQTGLVLIGRRHLRTNNSWTHNVPSLNKAKGLCTLQMNPLDADARGLVDGARAYVASATGSVAVDVEVTADLRPGVVSLPHGFGHDLPGVELSFAAGQPGANANLLTNALVVDGPSGNAVLNGIPVTVTALADRDPKDG